MEPISPVFLGGRLATSAGTRTFAALNPATGEPLGQYPISPWHEIEAALEAATEAYHTLVRSDPERIAAFLNEYAARIDDASDELARVAAAETGLPASPRFTDVEIPRTTNQLRQAGRAAIERSWVEPVLSPEARICSYMAPIPGVVCVFGPNNFPFAFNGVCGGDFAAAVATRHPVIAKANPGHPGTTLKLASLAAEAVDRAGLPAGTVQMLYRTSHEDGSRLVADRRVAATAFTGARQAGLALKATADAAGKPIYLEMSSVNPVVVLPGAVASMGDSIASELAASALLGSGQFCTSPGVLFLVASPDTDVFLARFTSAVCDTPASTLLGENVKQSLVAAAARWTASGATVLGSGPPGSGQTVFPNTVMTVDGRSFLENPEGLQTEAFGNMSLVVVTEDIEQLMACLLTLEGNLTGTVYLAEDGSDDDIYGPLATILRERVGRLLNNKPPTGVAVVPAMNHGGPYPATGHSGFTAVGIPTSLKRFAMLQCFDNVQDARLPLELQASNPLRLIRRVDHELTDRAVSWGSSK